MLERNGTMNISQGLHFVQVLYFNSGYDFGLEVSFKGPSTNEIKQTIPQQTLIPHGVPAFFNLANNGITDNSNGICN